MGLLRRPREGSIEAELTRRRRAGSEAAVKPGRRYLVGVDLGQVNDYSTVAVCEVAADDPVVLHVRHLERWRGLPYTEVVERVERIMESPELAGRGELVVDKTGVGAGVADLFARSGRRLTAVTITGGDRVSNPAPGVYGVPKKDLVGTLQIMLEAGRLKIASSLEHAGTLREELLNFRVKVNVATGHDSYEAHREGDHDDLVLAAAMAAWKANYRSPEPRIRRLKLSDSPEEVAGYAHPPPGRRDNRGLQ